jgi:hypothetical protein
MNPLDVFQKNRRGYLDGVSLNSMFYGSEL